jgi:predicted N-acyltransferase
MVMTIKIAEDIDAIGQKDWDELAAGSFYATHAWARYQQRDPHSTARYVLVRDEQGRLAAAAPVYLVDREASARYDPSHLIPGLTRRQPGTAPQTVLVGNRRGYANKILLSDHAEHDDRALAALLSGVEDLTAEAGADRSWWLYLDAPDMALLTAATTTSAPLLLAADCSIPLPGGSFDDFLSAAPKRTREQIRRDRRVFADANYTVTSPPFAASWAEMAPLMASHQQHHGHATDTASMSALLRDQARDAGEGAIVSACSRGDRMVGCALAFCTPVEAAARAYGFDHAMQGSACEYFELTYYRLIEAAYRRGTSRVHLGIGTLRTKIRRGAGLSLRWAVATGPGAPEIGDSTVRQANIRQWSDIKEQVGPYGEALAPLESPQIGNLTV